jgi:hypothetical protein
MTMRSLTPSEKQVIRSFAERLSDPERDQLLADVESALVETITKDRSRIVFSIRGYDRPPYRGQHPFRVEGKVTDRDGVELSVLLHSDENGRLFELEIVRFDEGEVIAPDWNTLRVL